MSQLMIYLLLGLALFLLGLQGLLTVHERLRQVIAVNLMGVGVFMLMVALGTRSTPMDPVLQALVVTGLVISLSATAFALRLTVARNRHEQSRSEHPEEPEP